MRGLQLLEDVRDGLYTFQFIPMYTCRHYQDRIRSCAGDMQDGKLPRPPTDT